jgi:hypothetical protein
MTVPTRKFENTGKCSNIKNVAPDPGRVRSFSLSAATPARMPQTEGTANPRENDSPRRDLPGTTFCRAHHLTGQQGKHPHHARTKVRAAAPLMTPAGIRIFISGTMPTVACLPLASPRRRTRQRGHRGRLVYRWHGRVGWLRSDGSRLEQVPFAVLTAVGSCAAAAGGRIVTQRAGGVGASGLALAEQVVTVLADAGGLAAGPREPAAGRRCCSAVREQAGTAAGPAGT